MHIQVAVEVLKNTASLVNLSQLSDTMGKIVSLSENLTSALRYKSWFISCHINTEVDVSSV